MTPDFLQGSPGPSGPKGDRGEPVSNASVLGLEGWEFPVLGLVSVYIRGLEVKVGSIDGCLQA